MIRRRLAGATFTLLFLALAALRGHAGAAPPGTEGLPATVVVLETGRPAVVVGEPRARERFTPCSTFKIPSALIAIDAGVVVADDSLLAWDAERDPRQEWWPASWPRSHDLRSAIRNSVVWYFQDLARRVGAGEMRRQLERLGYGNADVGGGVDRFWLSSSLRISAAEQARFLERLRHDGLGFSAEAREFLWQAIVLEGVPGEILRGKTGACPLPDGTYIGWLVGEVEHAGRRALYAANAEAPSFGAAAERRTSVARDVLGNLGLLPPSR